MHGFTKLRCSKFTINNYESGWLILIKTLFLWTRFIYQELIVNHKEVFKWESTGKQSHCLRVDVILIRNYLTTYFINRSEKSYFLASSFDNQSNPSYRPFPCVAQVAWMYHCKNKH